jgi:hypothetical protein
MSEYCNGICRGGEFVVRISPGREVYSALYIAMLFFLAYFKLCCVYLCEMNAKENIFEKKLSENFYVLMPLTTSNGNYGSRNQGDQMI